MSSDSPDERRHFSRVTFDNPGVLTSGGYSLDVQVRDLSLNGALLELPASSELSHNARCRLELPLSAEATICMDLELMHREGSLAGFRCLAIDLDSMSHLRRLVELNTGNTDLLQRELSELAR